jgi:hypothetical protein
MGALARVLPLLPYGGKRVHVEPALAVIFIGWAVFRLNLAALGV